MKTEAPMWSEPKRYGFFDDPAPDAPYMEAPFDWTETQGDLAPIIRKVERGLIIATLVMAGWLVGCLMALYVMKGVW